MDLLFKRYASPFVIMDEMIAMGRLSDFITYFLKQEQEDIQWEFWLHKVQGMSFEEYKNKCAEKNKSYAMSTKQVEAQVNKSKQILKGFAPK